MKNRLWMFAAFFLGGLPALGLAQTEPAPAAGTVAADYLIGPGDDLQIFVWRNPELTVNVPVKPDGRITTPLVENMVAVGKTTGQLARDMETVLSQYVRTPQVNVIVTASECSATPCSSPMRNGIMIGCATSRRAPL